MALKADEIFVRDSLVNHFGRDQTIKTWEGEDPPDIYINLDGETIAVEITRLSPISFNQDGLIENRNTQDTFGCRLCDELNLSLGCLVPLEIGILLVLEMPVKNARKYKKELQKILEDFINETPKVDDRKTMVIADKKTTIIAVPGRDSLHKKITGIVGNKNSSCNITNDSIVILANRIREKQEKCKKIKHDGPVWLALYNEYWLASHETYVQAIKDVCVKHDFERIYLVMDTGVTHQLFGN